MDININTLMFIGVVLAVAGAAYALYRSGQALTLQSAAQAIAGVPREAEELLAVAQAGVQLAQELKRTGEIASGSEAAQIAENYVLRFFPDANLLLIRDTVRGVYFAVRSAGGDLPDMRIVNDTAAGIPPQEL
jgi:hypothetical protein